MCVSVSSLPSEISLLSTGISPVLVLQFASINSNESSELSYLTQNSNEGDKAGSKSYWRMPGVKTGIVGSSSKGEDALGVVDEDA